jgi:uncharacterized protein (TIGR02246 family)
MRALTEPMADADQISIQDVLQSYETSLNASNTDAVLALFAPDGVFMPQHAPAMVGLDAIRAAYQGIFQTITFDIELAVAEVVQVAPDWAFVRTNSAGFVDVHAINQRVPDANHELFVFQKRDGAWKIARYCFSTVNPPPQ